MTASDVEPVTPRPGETALSQFDLTVGRHPHRPAIHYFERTYDWSELDRSSRAFGSWLVRSGVERGDRVAVWLQNVPEFVIALVGTWRAGATVVPLNPMLREKEVSYQLSDSEARVVVAESGLIDGVGLDLLESCSGVSAVLTVPGPDSPSGPGSLSVSAHPGGVPFGQALAEPIDDRLDQRAPRPGDTAYLVYTSGTTGQPKAAMNTQANVAFNTHVFRTWMHLGESDVILGGAPLFHITGLLAGVGASHVTGCPLVLFYRFEAARCIQAIRETRATFTVIPSTAIRALLDSAELCSSEVATLTKLYSGGAPIPARLAEEWEQATGHRVYSIYGLTETTSPSHAAPFGRPVRAHEESGMLAVGVPVQGVECKVVDESGEEVPDGSLGEIWIKGPMVVPGYWNRPEASAAAITDGYLHTGDVGMRDSDGWYYVVDRIKDMINASGFKVWPREVEDFLLTHPAVAEAAVVGVPDPYRGETVKAFVRLRDGREATAEEIISWARERMAAYKYPRLVELVQELPKTASGKVLRRELRDKSELAGSGQAASAPK